MTSAAARRAAVATQVASRNVVVITFVAAFATFACLAAAGITWMDPGELAQAAYNLGGAHPPGHPGHSLLGKLATLLPVGEVAFRLNVLSAAAMAAALAGVVALLRALVPGQGVAALAVAALAILSPVVQENAVRTEVYAPAVALVVWAAVLVIRFVRKGAGRPAPPTAARPDAPDTPDTPDTHDAPDTPDTRSAPAGEASRPGDGRLLLVAAALCSLAAGFHPLIAAAAAGPLAIAGFLAARGRWRRLVPLAALLAPVGAVLYLYLPLRANAARPPALMWGDPATPGALLQVLGGSAYRDNFAVDGAAGRLAELVLLTSDGSGAGLVWAGVVGLAFAAITGLRGAGVVLAAAFVVLLAAAAQARTNPDMAGYVLPALLFLAVGLAVLPAAALRLIAADWRGSGKRHVVAAVVCAPVIGFSLAAPSVRAGGGVQRGDDALRYWDDTVARMAPGPGVYFANSDYSLFAGQYEQLVAGGRPDVVLGNATLCRDRWFLAHLDRLLPELHVPFIDDGVRGDLAERLAVDNLRRSRPVAGDVPAFGALDPTRAVPMGRGYRYPFDPGDDRPPAPAAPPPAYAGGVGSRVGGRIGLVRASWELGRGRLDQAAIAAGLAARVAPEVLRSLAEVTPAPERPPLLDHIPQLSPVFIHEPWQVELVGDEIAWRAGVDPAALFGEPTRSVPERQLHAIWRALATPGVRLSRDALDPALRALEPLGRDAELATAGLLIRLRHDPLAEHLLRAVIERRGADHKNLVMLGSSIGNRGTAEALAEAESLFERATRLAPDRAEPWVRLGVAQRKQNKIEAARDSWLRALQLDPGRQDAAAFLRSAGASSPR